MKNIIPSIFDSLSKVLARGFNHVERIRTRKPALMKTTFFAGFVLALLTFSANPFEKKANLKANLAKSDAHEKYWVDSVYYSLTIDERIGQLLMVRAHSDKDFAYEQKIASQIRDYKVGGLCFFQGTADKQARLTNDYQSMSNVPLMISMDAEWGLGMRLSDCISFPKQINLGAIKDNRLLYEMGQDVAAQCKRLGVHVNFAPVTDINNNPNNPVINDRSFGEDRYNVTVKSYLYALGMQDGGVMACAKHFPGHGDTDVDSHEDLPVIRHSTERLDSLELFPFRVLFQHGVGAVMVAHLNVPALDSRKDRPTTLSDRTVHRLLRKSIGFEGLIFTDAMEMKGVTKYFPPGEADVAAFKAGNDVILLPENVEAAFKALKKAVMSGDIESQSLENSVRRILRAKYRLGLTKRQYVSPDNILRDLTTPKTKVLVRKLRENGLTLVRDNLALVPIKQLESRKIATLAIGANGITTFQKTAGLYGKMIHRQLPKGANVKDEQALLKELGRYDLVLISLHGMKKKAAESFGLSVQEIALVNKLAKQQKVILTVFGNPYSLKYFDEVHSVLMAYDESYDAQDLAAQAIFGANNLKGMLPVTASASAAFGMGEERISAVHRLGYDLPERVGMSSDTLAKMDDLVKTIIGTGAAPGCQILVARHGKVIWNKAYGYHTYEQMQPVSEEDMYDLASVTKVAATTLATMKLYNQGNLQLDTFTSTYVPLLKNTDKAYLRVEEMLAHHSGLRSFIPFYEATVTPQNFPSHKYYKDYMDDTYSVEVCNNLFMNCDYQDTIWRQIAQSELRSTKGYKYSDLGMYLCMKAVENVTAEPFDAYVERNFYDKLGCSTTMYNPWKYGLQNNCTPSEEDRYFRQKRIQGYVHDMGAAMLGGVSGHAGLFSNANDLAKIFQMLLNKGTYFDNQYFEPSTVETFATRYPGSSRRGLGFDMKELDRGSIQNMSHLASDKAFGHLGFTGTCAWADPATDMVFIFLSNRTYPTMRNNKMNSEDYRMKLQTIAYQSIVKQEEVNP